VFLRFTTSAEKNGPKSQKLHGIDFSSIRRYRAEDPRIELVFSIRRYDRRVIACAIYQSLGTSISFARGIRQLVPCELGYGIDIPAPYNGDFWLQLTVARNPGGAINR
jgi:hypothetical protein